jgi:hypothetical protein
MYAEIKDTYKTYFISLFVVDIILQLIMCVHHFF